jgi:hypothetical protein
MTNYTIQFTKKDSLNDKVIIPYGTHQTNYNKTTFRQSTIDHTLINNPQINLYDKITNSENYATILKTLVCNDIFPKTTNTMLTVCYTSYIKTKFPQTTDIIRKPLIYYYCTDEGGPAIVISVINSTQRLPQLLIAIKNKNGNTYKEYDVRQDASQLAIELTADLSVARPGEEEIVSAQFPVSDCGGN